MIDSRSFLLRSMKGAHKFSPSSGAELSREREYPGTIPLRETLDGSGELFQSRSGFSVRRDTFETRR